MLVNDEKSTGHGLMPGLSRADRSRDARAVDESIPGPRELVCECRTDRTVEELCSREGALVQKGEVTFTLC